MKSIALVGNQNCGKTTLFNALTGGDLRTGNWPGVTVTLSRGTIAGHKELTLVDLPGVYSLTPFSAEEKVTAACLTEGGTDLILNILDATCLSRSLFLTFQLLSLGRPMVLALNLMDEAEKMGIAIHLPALSAALGVPVFPISARKGTGLQALTNALAGALPPAGQVFPTKPEDAYAAIDNLLTQCVKAPAEKKPTALDALLLSRIWAFPIMAALMFFVFFLTFGPLGRGLSNAFSYLTALGSRETQALLCRLGAAPYLTDFIVNGALAGVGCVLSFLPVVTLLFVLLAILEDTGYLARAAFLLDAPLAALGLNGFSLLPLLMGFGCTVPALLSARVLKDENARKSTLLLTPFLPCSAKVPVYFLLSSALFGQGQAMVLCFLYLLGAAALVCYALVIKKPPDDLFLLELPTLRLPTLKSVAKSAGRKAKEFVERAFTVVFLCSLVIWLLQKTGGLSLLSGLFCPVFAPLGFGSPAAVAALFTGLLAKESILSTLSVLLGTAPLSTLLPAPAAALSYLTFIALYAPCAASLAMLKKELGGKAAVARAFLVQNLIAWLCAFAVFQIGKLVL